MKVIFAGTPEVAVPALEALHRAHTVVGVVTRPDAPVGRKRILTPSPVAIRAADLGLPTYKTRHFDVDAFDFVSRSAADIGVVVAYGALIPEPALSAPIHGWINAHFSQLPEHRGAAPLQRDIMTGATNAGLSIFQLVSELDAGDVYEVTSHPLDKDETAGNALHRLALIAAKRLVTVATDIVGGHAHAIPQVGVPTYAHKLTSDDGQLHPEMSIRDAFNHYRGVTPEPGAWVASSLGRLKIVECTLGDSQLTPAGTIAVVDGDVRIGFTGGELTLLRVQPAGKSVMSATDWARGLPANSSWTFE